MNLEQKHNRRTADSQFKAVQEQNRSSDLLRVASESNMSISVTKVFNDPRLPERAFSNWRWASTFCKNITTSMCCLNKTFCILKLFLSLFIKYILLFFQSSINDVNDMQIFDIFKTALNILLNITILRCDNIDIKYHVFEN